MADKAPKFTFQYLEGKKFPSLAGKEENESYFRWSLQKRMVAQTFSFDQAFQPYQKDDFTLAFFQDPEVLKNLVVVDENSSHCPLGMRAGSVRAEPLGTTEVSMTFFDRLRDEGLVREEGGIKKCFDEFHQDMLLSHSLAQMLVLEDCDHWSLYSEAERDELLFCVFRLLVLGGRANQYDNDITQYELLTKRIYKDLVSVQKDPVTGAIRVTSIAYRITAFDENGKPFYPSHDEFPHIQDFAYLIIDPLKRHVTVFSHRFGFTPTTL